MEALATLLWAAAITAGGQFVISAETIGAVGPQAQATIHKSKEADRGVHSLP